MTLRRPAWLAAAGAVLAVLGATALVPPATAYGQVTETTTGTSVATTTGTSGATTADPQTPDVPEPPPLGYIAPYAPATAPPATDIKPLPQPSRPAGSAGVAALVSTYPCVGYSGLQSVNPLAAVEADTFAWSTFAPYQVGDGTGNINWTLNPYVNSSWYMYLHSLRWLGQAIMAGKAGDPVAMDHAKAVAQDWIADNPYPWNVDVGAHEATMHRTNVLICLREAIMATSPGGVLPQADAWLDDALLAHAMFIQNYFSGPGNNHGTDESVALLGVGCLLGRTDLRDLAIDRLSQGITTVIDPEGASNEQSTGYAQFNYSLWGRAERALADCNISTGTTIAQRRHLLAGFLAQTTNPLGKLAQLGDSEVDAAVPFPGTDAEWAGSQGTLGSAPEARVSQYQAGYVFGRSGWGNGSRPFRLESFYSLRYGPARALHGHFDHTSLTYVARGRDILIDGGHPGYVQDQWRGWAMSAFAHNEMTTPTAKPWTFSITTLTRSVIQAGGEFYEVTDQPNRGITRTRGVLALHDPDLLVVLDRGSSATSQQWQTLWHLPSDQMAVVHSQTTAIATKAGDKTSTVLFQLPFKEALPPGAILTTRGQTLPTIQGWHYPTITLRNPASTVMFARTGTSATILSVIAPIRVGSGVTSQLTPAENGWTNVDLRVAGVPVRVRISLDNALSRG